MSFSKETKTILDNISKFATLASLIVGAVGIWWYIQDERNRSIEQVEKLNEIRTEQESIRRELALQTADLEAIRSTQTEIVGGQRWLSSEVNRVVGDMAYNLGRHSQQHLEIQPLEE